MVLNGALEDITKLSYDFYFFLINGRVFIQCPEVQIFYNFSEFQGNNTCLIDSFDINEKENIK